MPKEVNAECYITARMNMQRLYDFEREKALLKERFPDWQQRGAMFGWNRLGDRFFEQALPIEWFELGMMFALHEQGKLK